MGSGQSAAHFLFYDVPCDSEADLLVTWAYATSMSWVIPYMTCGTPFTGSGMKQTAK